MIDLMQALGLQPGERCAEGSPYPSPNPNPNPNPNSNPNPNPNPNLTLTLTLTRYTEGSKARSTLRYGRLMLMTDQVRVRVS